MIWQAVWAGFGYFQREAGYTRTGSHNSRVHGRETGQWHEADLAVAHWLQHTSRDGDMQLHVHSQIAHVAKTVTDGKWRAPDSLGYNEHVGAVAAIVSQHLEEALTRRFGVEWVARDDGHGFEIKGISGQMMRLFSSRRESITADLRARAAQFEQRYGRAAVPARAGAARAGVELQHARGQGRRRWISRSCTRAGRTSSRALSACRWRRSRRRCGTTQAGTQPRTPRRPRRPGPHRARADPRGAEGGRAGPAGKEHLDPRRCGQVPGPGAAPVRHGPGRGRRAARRPRRPGAASEFEPVVCLEAPEPVRGSAQLAARRRAQRLPAARRRAVRHPRAAGHGRTHGRAGTAPAARRA